MLFACTHCHHQFRVESEKISPAGTRVRCSKCGNLVRVTPSSLIAGDLSSPGTEAPRTSSKPKRSQPLLFRDVSQAQFITRFCAAAVVTFAGLISGLLLLGVRPSLENLQLLAGYGQWNLNRSNVTILRHQGQVVTTDEGRQWLVIDGELYNASGRTVETIRLRIEMRDSGSEVLTNATTDCCGTPLRSGTVTPFSLRIEVSKGQLSSYRLDIEAADGKSVSQS